MHDAITLSSINRTDTCPCAPRFMFIKGRTCIYILINLTYPHTTSHRKMCDVYNHMKACIRFALSGLSLYIEEYIESDWDNLSKNEVSKAMITLQ